VEDATTATDVAAVLKDGAAATAILEDATTAADDAVAAVLEDEEDSLDVFDLNLPPDEFRVVDFDFVENITGKLNYSFLLTKY
jgi:DNA-binding GntR family transcriptional regulator